MSRSCRVGSLAAGIAHELNNPIGIILSRIELMLMEVEEQPRGRVGHESPGPSPSPSGSAASPRL
jgi:signal transduction histidine kinase